LLALAASAEQGSEHPLGAAIVTAAANRSLHLEPAGDFTSMPGQGVAAIVAGRRVTVGRPPPTAPAPSALTGMVERVQGAGQTAVVVTVDGTCAGIISVSDELRPGGPAAVSALGALTGRPPVMLTGDNRGAAEHIASQVGIHEVRSGLLPEDKVDAIRAWQRNGANVTLVGDGVNDAPALAAAHLGVAMGRHGSDLALETADAVIVRDELGTLPAVIALSRRARRVIAQNLAFASFVILALVAVDLAGHLPLPLGVAGHEGSTVVVGLNGLRLLSRRTWAACSPLARSPASDAASPSAPGLPHVGRRGHGSGAG
jgi:P-type E1-E2 ATPase